jgi:flagellar motor switch protein FliM
MTPTPYDFRKPPPGELEGQVAGWLALACRRAAAWSRLLPYPAELKPGRVGSVTTAAGLAALPEDALAFPVTTPDAADGSLLLGIRRPLLLALLAGLLGESPTALPADRDPTDLEASLVGYIVRELFLDPLEKGWTGADAPQLTAGAPGLPRVVWRRAGKEMILLAAPVVSAPFGEHPVHLFVPRVGRWEKMAQASPHPASVVPAREQIEALVREMPVDLAVVLGTADLTMRDLAHLKAGDLVVLRQKVDQPLDGLVAGARKFRVWPGVVGARAAVQIDALAED